MMITVQYLEDNPDIPGLTVSSVRKKLRAAFERLPVSVVILGWSVPQRLTQACAEETASAGAQLYLWLPLLTGAATRTLPKEWQVTGLAGERIPAYQGKPEFTFLCPNNPQAVESILDNLESLLQAGTYQGVFLDRIRYPSPAEDPAHHLACFCPECHHQADQLDLDLDAARKSIQALLSRPDRLMIFLKQLLDPASQAGLDPDQALVRQSLDFRSHSITRLVKAASLLIHRKGLSVGLDCFSPALAPMVGQNLSALSEHCDWIKLMTYGHVLAPAGLPYELLSLAGWLIRQGVFSETDALAWLSQSTHLALPATSAELRERGIPPHALAMQVKQARAAGIRTLLAGIELVDLPAVTHLDPAQIAADLRALRLANPDGLALSWDLRFIPLERLELVARVWLP